MPTGKLIKWNEDRGFGFIQPAGASVSEPDLFVHITSMPGQRAPEALGVAVSYEVVADERSGKSRAVGVSYLSGGDGGGRPVIGEPVRYRDRA